MCCLLCMCQGSLQCQREQERAQRVSLHHSFCDCEVLLVLRMSLIGLCTVPVEVFEGELFVWVGGKSEGCGDGLAAD